MSKGYAIALIFTTLSVFGSLFYLQHRMMAAELKAISDYAEGVHKRVITLKQESMSEAFKKLDDDLQDDTKFRFRPILPFIDKAQKREEVFLKAAANEENLSMEGLLSLNELRQAHLEDLLTDYTTLLEDFGHQMDLRADDIDVKLKHISAAVKEESHQAMPTFSTTSFSQGRDLLVLQYLNAMESVVLDAIQIAGGRVISCGGYFPVFVANIYNPKRGQLVKAKVSIGSYSTALNPDNIILTAGNDTLTINPDGTADYEFSASKRGQHTIDLRFQITNPLTGLVQTGEGSYIYNIR